MIKFVEKNCGGCCMNVELMGILIRSMSRSRACVTLGARVGEYFEVGRGLRQERVMSPWLLNIFLDRVV